MKARVTLGPGTHAIKGLRSRGDWFHDGSEFCARAGNRGLACSYFPWPTALAGAEFWKPWVGIKPDLGDWEIPALNAKERHQPSEVEPRYWPRPSRIHWFTHSHGAEPIIIACALGLRINVLVTVSAPIRADVLYEYGERARQNIGYHLEYRSLNDRIQKAGGVGDGHWGTMWSFADFTIGDRQIFKPDDTIVMPEECGHSQLLHNPKYMDALDTAFQIILDRDGRDDLLGGAAWA